MGFGCKFSIPPLKTVLLCRQECNIPGAWGIMTAQFFCASLMKKKSPRWLLYLSQLMYISCIPFTNIRRRKRTVGLSVFRELAWTRVLTSLFHLFLAPYCFPFKTDGAQTHQQFKRWCQFKVLYVRFTGNQSILLNDDEKSCRSTERRDEHKFYKV